MPLFSKQPSGRSPWQTPLSEWLRGYSHGWNRRRRPRRWITTVTTTAITTTATASHMAQAWWRIQWRRYSAAQWWNLHNLNQCTQQAQAQHTDQQQCTYTLTTRMCTHTHINTSPEALRIVAGTHIAHTLIGEAYDRQSRRVPHPHCAVWFLPGGALSHDDIHLRISGSFGGRYHHLRGHAFAGGLCRLLCCTLGMPAACGSYEASREPTASTRRHKTLLL